MSAPTVATLEVRPIALTELFPHPQNRKHFDTAQLQELAQSLQEKGQLTPALVRPDPAGEGYQLLAGERRWRAAQIAGLDTLLCLVRELDDQAALEVLAIENNQREDIHPLEEAELFKALLTFEGNTVAGIAGKLRRTETYVRDRLRLLRLIPRARQLMFNGEIPLAHAVLLASLAPADQARAIGEDTDRTNFGAFHIHGLFRSEYTLFEREQYRVAVSLAEFRDWIRKCVRFDPKAEVAAELFPETAAAVAEAESSRGKVLYLTTEYQADSQVKVADVRTIGSAHWKRADGTKGAKACEHAELGVVVSGELQGQAFKVCIRKDKCTTHWRDEVAARTQRQAEATGEAAGTTKAEPQESWEERSRREREEREAREKLWNAAEPRLLELVAEKVKAMPFTLAGPIATAVLSGAELKCARKYLGAPKTAEELLRAMAFEELARSITTDWLRNQVQRELKPFGVDARKVLAEVEKEQAAKAAPKEKPAKKLAGDVRRERKAKKGGKR